MNDKIRAPEVRVIAPDGGQIGVKKRDEALWLADQLGLDLVEVAPDAKPPVVRMMDYGKWKYEQSVRNREARKKQVRTSVKEVKFRTKIDEHDYEVKLRRALEFLEEGHKVKVIVMFWGREITHPELGTRLLAQMQEDVDGHAVVESAPRLDGRNMTMVLAPDRAAQARARRAQEIADAARESAPDPAAAEDEAAPATAGDDGGD